MMTTKEKIIRKALIENENELLTIERLLDANPVSEICNIRIEAQKLLKENPGVEARISNEFSKKWDSFIKREKEQKAIYEKSKNSSDLIKRAVALRQEISDLKTELYQIENKRL